MMHHSLPKSTPIFSVSVLGLPSIDAARAAECAPNADDLQRSGVGKTSLCQRFVLPSFDDFRGQSLRNRTAVSKRDFDSDRRINGVHYLYHGRAVRTHGDRLVEFHIVEHTTLVDEETLERHHTDEAEVCYSERATASSLSRPAKLACFVGVGQDEASSFPDRAFSDGAHGYVFAFDCSAADSALERQVELLQSVVEIAKHQSRPLAVALTKCDAILPERHAAVRQKHIDLLTSLACFEVSASDGIGVDVPFLYLFVSQLENCQTVPKPLPYSTQIMVRRQAERRAWREFREILTAKVVHFDTTWAEVVEAAGRSSPMAALFHFRGRAVMRENFRWHLVQLMEATLRSTFRRSLEEHPDFVEGDLDSAAFESSVFNGTCVSGLIGGEKEARGSRLSHFDIWAHGLERDVRSPSPFRPRSSSPQPEGQRANGPIRGPGRDPRVK